MELEDKYQFILENRNKTPEQIELAQRLAKTQGYLRGTYLQVYALAGYLQQQNNPLAEKCEEWSQQLRDISDAFDSHTQYFK